LPGIFSIENKNVKVSAIKNLYEGEGLAIRLFNPCETTQIVKVDIRTYNELIELDTSGKKCRAFFCNLNEEIQEEIKVDENIIMFEILPKKITTLAIMIK